MAAAQNYTLVFLGASGRTYHVSGYTADTAGVVNTFSTVGNAGAGAAQYFVPPENVSLIDFSMTTGTTQTSMVLTDNGATRNGCLLMFVPHLSTNSNRPRLNIPFNGNRMIGAITI